MSAARRLFVSYTAADQAWAEWIGWNLEAHGHVAVLQAWDFGPGVDFVHKMHAATKDCAATIAVLSPDYLESRFAEAEWRVAFAADPSGDGRKLIPIRVRECTPDGLLATRVYLDLVGRTPDEARRLLASTLRSDRGKPTTEPAHPAASRAFPGGADGFADLRHWLLAQFGHVELLGLGAGDFDFDLDEVYVSLRIAARPWSVDGDHPRHAGDLELGGGRDVSLERALELADRKQLELAVFGEPGAGKTTVLRKLLHQTLTAGATGLGLAGPTLPLFLRLRRLDRARLAGSIAEWIQAELDELAPSRFPAPFAAELWDRGDLLLLLDGLDEIADDGLRADACRFLERELTGVHPRGIRAVVSSRYAGHGGGVRLGGQFLHVDVRKLDDDEVKSLARSWFRAAGRAREPDPNRWPQADQKARETADRLIAQLAGKEYSTRQILELVSSPLLLTLLCIVVVRGGEVPRRRTQFYGECLRVLLGRWSSAKGIPQPVDVDDALTLLAGVALHLHLAGRRDDLATAEFESLLRDPVARLGRARGRDITCAELLRWLHRGAGVFAEYAPGVFGFSHLGLQEYLTATQIAREGGTRLSELAGHFGEKWWREVTLLVVGLPEHRVFVPLLLEVVNHGPITDHLDHLRACLDDAHEPSPTPFVAVLTGPAKARSWLGKLLAPFLGGNRRAADPARQAAVLAAFIGRRDPDVAAAALGLVDSPHRELSDLAHRVATESGLEVPGERSVPAVATKSFVEPATDLKFLFVPGGSFEMGATGIANRCEPPHQVYVSDFWLAETPVTNRQYSIFLGESAKVEQPAYWRDSRFNGPDQPVVGVSWHDALAFCEWLSRKSKRAVHLPSEAQRERAARGDNGRRYPWGNAEPDATRAVFGQDWSSGQPAPVGSVPGGRGPYFHLDLAGNVWEWCADHWDEETYKRDERRSGSARDPLVTAVKTNERALRGGSWIRDAGYLHSSYRYRGDAGSRVGGIGFRVAVSSSSTVT